MLSPDILPTPQSVLEFFRERVDHLGLTLMNCADRVFGNLSSQYSFGDAESHQGTIECNRKGGGNQRPKIKGSKYKKPIPVPRPAITEPPKGKGK